MAKHLHSSLSESLIQINKICSYEKLYFHFYKLPFLPVLSYIVSLGSGAHERWLYVQLVYAAGPC